MNYDVAVIGGGAAGLACAVRLVESGKKLKIAIIDAGERLGKKLAATGNGQGNISNSDMTVNHYHGGGACLAKTIACEKPRIFEDIFDCLFTADDKGRIYPSGKQASALTDCLLRKLNGKADIFLFSKVIHIKDGFEITLLGGKKLNAQFVVLATGGKAQKQFKTDGSAYELACMFGHRLTALYPSIVQLKTQTKFIKNLKGIRADCRVTALENGRQLSSARGDVIFTEYGVSGNAVFSVSSAVCDRQNAVLSFEFLPDIPVEKILDNLALRRAAGYNESELLSGTLHNQLGKAIISRAKEEGADIADTVKNFLLPVTGTLGFDYAQVTRGGVDVKDISDKLESRIVKNLFFAGEILDVDGDCGGYNLQWAFSSGVTVAEAIIKRYD